MREVDLWSVLILGHRGAVHSSAPENTLASIERALQQGADGVEIDVRLTADRVVVVHHDPAVKQGRAISSLQYAALPLVGTHRVPRLEEVLELVVGRGQLVVELKAPHWSTRVGTVAALVEVLGGCRLAGVVVSSFDRAAVLRVREAGLGVRTGLLGRPGVPLDVLLRRVRDDGHTQAHPHVLSALSRTDLLRPPGIEVIAWTVNRPGHLRRLQVAGVAGVITDGIPAARASLPVPFARTG